MIPCPSPSPPAIVDRLRYGAIVTYKLPGGIFETAVLTPAGAPCGEAICHTYEDAIRQHAEAWAGAMNEQEGKFK